MAISVDITPRIDRRRYKELPRGCSRWTASDSSLAGVGTSTTTFNIQFNPQNDENFQRYVSLSRLVIASATAALVILGGIVRLSATDWEDDAGVMPIAKLEFINQSVTANYVATLNESIYLGRIQKGQTGELRVIMQEIASTTYDITAAGFISERPFLAPDFWRA